MSIGLFDNDFMTYTHVLFNLELMKISAYYKKRREVVIMAPFFEPERHEKVFFRKDYNDGIFNKKILEPNVDYGGYAFSGELYKPLDEGIESTYPDKYLYEKYRNTFCINGSMKNLFDTMQNAEHIRLSLDNKTVWNKALSTFKPTLQTRTVIFHDYNLNSIENGFEAVSDIMDELNPKLTQGRLIGMKFPIQLYNEKDVERWCSFNPTAHLFSMQFNGLMPDEAFNFLMVESKNSVARQLYYNMTPEWSNEKDFIANLPQFYRHCLMARKLKRKIYLKYEDNFFMNPLWEKLIKLIMLYTNMEQTYDPSKYMAAKDISKTFTLYRYITNKKFRFAKKKDYYPVEELREIFQLVREKSYETFKMFYENSTAVFEGGKIVERL